MVNPEVILRMSASFFLKKTFVLVELFTKLLKGDELDDEELSGKEQKDHCRISAKVK